MGFFSKGLKNEFETAVVNEPSVFEPLKFYCICNHSRGGITPSNSRINTVFWKATLSWKENRKYRSRTFVAFLKMAQNQGRILLYTEI